MDENSPGYRNEILFFSHDNAKQASERVQGVTMHDVWLDELPDSWKLVEELQRRTDARRVGGRHHRHVCLIEQTLMQL